MKTSILIFREHIPGEVEVKVEGASVKVTSLSDMCETLMCLIQKLSRSGEDYTIKLRTDKNYKDTTLISEVTLCSSVANVEGTEKTFYDGGGAPRTSWHKQTYDKPCGCHGIALGEGGYENHLCSEHEDSGA